MLRQNNTGRMYAFVTYLFLIAGEHLGKTALFLCHKEISYEKEGNNSFIFCQYNNSLKDTVVPRCSLSFAIFFLFLLNFFHFAGPSFSAVSFLLLAWIKLKE